MSQLTPYLRQLLSLDVAGTWRAVKCPVIGLFGEMDKQVLPSNAAELLRLQPKAQVQVFPKLNHPLPAFLYGLAYGISYAERTLLCRRA